MGGDAGDDEIIAGDAADGLEDSGTGNEAHTYTYVNMRFRDSRHFPAVAAAAAGLNHSAASSSSPHSSSFHSSAPQTNTHLHSGGKGGAAPQPTTALAALCAHLGDRQRCAADELLKASAAEERRFAAAARREGAEAAALWAAEGRLWAQAATEQRQQQHMAYLYDAAGSRLSNEGPLLVGVRGGGRLANEGENTPTVSHSAGRRVGAGVCAPATVGVSANGAVWGGGAFAHANAEAVVLGGQCFAEVKKGGTTHEAFHLAAASPSLLPAHASGGGRSVFSQTPMVAGVPQRITKGAYLMGGASSTGLQYGDDYGADSF